MPSPRDLTGQRFGHLTVLRPAGRVKYGPIMRAWLCRCDCGTEVTVPRVRLTGRSVDACPACRLGRACVVCGRGFIPASSRAITCSDACRAVRRKATSAAARKARDDANPAAVAARHRRHRERVKSDPLRAQRARNKKAAWYAINRAEVNARRRDERAAETAEERAQRLTDTRKYIRSWLAELRADPERYAEHLRRRAEIRRSQRLSDLARLGAELVGKI